MKVVILAPLPPPAGGIASWTVRMMEATLENGWTVDVVDERLIGKRELYGNKTKKNYFTEIKRCFKIWSDLWKKLNDPEVQVVHSCIPSYTLSMLREYVCACITKIKKRKFIVHFRCTVTNSVKGRVSTFVYKRICNKSDRIFLLNKESVEFTKQLTNTPIDLIPNFVDSGEIVSVKEIRPEIKNVVYVGGVIPTKGCLDMVEVAKAFPEITFTMVGAPSGELEEAVKNVSNVVITGQKTRQEVTEYLKNADAFMFLSYFLSEGFSNALVEAMAMGLPCIVSNWAANADMIEDKGGFAVPIKSPEAAIEALKKMFNQEVRKAQSEFNVKKVAEAYSEKVILSQYVNAYEKTIEK